MLDPKIRIVKASDCSKYTIFEETGIYDPNSNPGGYGFPNPEIAEVTEAKLDVYFPGSSTPMSFDLFPTFPNTTGIGFDVTPSILGISKLIDGPYKFVYTINGDQIVADIVVPFVASVNCTVVNLCNAECCVNKAVAQIPHLRCNCKANEHKIELFTLADVLLDAAERAACCGSMGEFDRILKDLMSICQETNCNC